MTIAKFGRRKQLATGGIKMGIFDLFSSSKQDEVFKAIAAMHESVEYSPEFQSQRELYDLLASMCNDGVDADELPNAVGEFGFSVTNPIPCKTTFGSIAYLAMLQAPDGRKVLYKRLGSFHSSVSPHSIDMYECAHPLGRKLGELYISPYQKRNSKKAPKGFMLRTNYPAQFFKYADVVLAMLESNL